MNDELRVDVDAGGQPAGLSSCMKPQGQDEKLGPRWSHRRKPMARSLWICLQPGGRGETRRRPGGRWTGRPTREERGSGKGRGGVAGGEEKGQLSICKWKNLAGAPVWWSRLGFFFPLPIDRLEQMHLYGETRSLEGMILVGMLHGERISDSKRAGRCTFYGEAARCGSEMSDPRVVEWEPPEWWSCQ